MFISKNHEKNKVEFPQPPPSSKVEKPHVMSMQCGCHLVGTILKLK